MNPKNIMIFTNYHRFAPSTGQKFSKLSFSNFKIKISAIATNGHPAGQDVQRPGDQASMDRLG